MEPWDLSEMPGETMTNNQDIFAKTPLERQQFIKAIVDEIMEDNRL